MNEETELLRQFADEGSQEAFAQLVARTINLVYAAALRQTGGDAHLAQDVTQGVFLALACQASSLKRHAILTGWLYTTTRFVAAKAVRTQARWQRREQEANIMTMPPNESEPAWAELRRVIDEAMHELAEKDRVALLLRFFEGRSLAEVGAAIGLAENSARMRVERALEKLRGRLELRGITSTAAVLGGALAAQPSVAAPAGLAASVAGTSLAAAAVGGGGAVATVSWLLSFMGTTKLVLGTVAVAAAVGLGAYLGAHYQSRSAPIAAATRAGVDSSELAALRKENQQLKASLAEAASAVASAAGPTGPTSTGAGVRPALTVMDELRLLMDLQRRKLATPQMQFVSRGAKLAPAFTELFGLTTTEQEALQSAVDAARDRLADLERENATVSRIPNGDVVITVKSFPEAGGATYDAMLKAFAETMGSERFNAFLALGVDQVEKELGRFGAPQRTITFSQKREHGGYAMKEKLKLPTEASNSSSDFRTFDDLANYVGPIVKLLPPDFGPRK